MVPAPPQTPPAAAAPAPAPFLEVAVASAVAAFLALTYLDARQLRALRLRAPPPALAGELGGEKHARARRYRLAAWRLGFLRRTCRLGEALIALGAGALPRLWALAGAVAAPGSAAAFGEPARAAAFALLLVAAAALLELPWALYATFVVERRHGFSAATPAVFAADALKTLLLASLCAPPLAAAATWALRGGGGSDGGGVLAATLWLAALLLAASLAWAFLWPVLVAPLFSEIAPLPPGPLRAAIEQMAHAAGQPLAHIDVADGSRRSTRSGGVHGGF